MHSKVEGASVGLNGFSMLKLKCLSDHLNRRSNQKQPCIEKKIQEVTLVGDMLLKITVRQWNKCRKSSLSNRSMGLKAY